MSIEAMKQALDFLEEHGTHYARHEDDYIKVMTALHQAIEQAEMVKKGTKAWANTPDDWVDDLRGGVEKQKPVAFRNTETGDFCTGGFLRKDWAKWQPLYAAPREWVDLTDEDRERVRTTVGYNQFMTAGEYAKAVQKATEAELREKNHG
jgi:hypothetical protein